MSDGSSSGEPRLVAGPLSAFDLALVAIGVLRRTPLLVLAGGVAIGAGLKLVGPRDRRLA